MFLGDPKDNFVGWGRGVGGRGPRPVFDKSTIINKFEISKSVRTPPLVLHMISIYLSVYICRIIIPSTIIQSDTVHLYIEQKRCKIVENPLCTDRHSIKDLFKFAKNKTTMRYMIANSLNGVQVSFINQIKKKDQETVNLKAYRIYSRINAAY